MAGEQNIRGCAGDLPSLKATARQARPSLC